MFVGILVAALLSQQVTLSPPSAPIEEGPPARLHLLEETLRIPFGEDWGGETHLGFRFDRLDVGLFARAWSEAPCLRPDCADRGVHAGAEVKVNLGPALDVGLDVGAYRGSTQRTGTLILPRARLKF
jgi:hypothetical protein